MFVHIIHLPVAAIREPCQQPRLSIGERGVGNTHLVETKLPTPHLDTCGQKLQVSLTARRIIVLHAHSEHDSEPPACLHLIDENATLTAGEQLAHALRPRMTIFLRGDLGAGKTTLTRGVLRGLGFGGRVKSPTYTLVEPYKDSRIVVYHFDFYRFTHAEEFIEAGLEEYFDGDGIRLVEWPDRAQPYLPAADLEIELRISASGGRRLELRALSTEGRKCLENFTATAGSQFQDSSAP